MIGAQQDEGKALVVAQQDVERRPEPLDELRLQQQYFFVAASIADFLDNQLSEDFDLENLPDRVIFQLNDTHPVIAVPELMRVLVDEKGMAWDAAWAITQRCFAYTCHTLLP